MKFGFLSRSRRGDACVAPTLVAILFLFACSASTPTSNNPTDLASSGRQVYLANCIVCHSTNPQYDGPIGPAILGSSRELIEARVMHAAYPPGYNPKRQTHIMLPLPHLQSQIPALAAYLQPK